MLETLGYTVLRATDGAEALAVAATIAGRIHLLLTDVIMPKLDAIQLARQLTLLRPDTRVVFLSGYSEDAIARHGLLDAGSDFIEKPFAPELLALSVRKTLDS